MITADNLSIDSLPIPKTEEVIRFFPEAREACIVMMETGPFHILPDMAQEAIATAYIMGYIAHCQKTWRSW